MITFLRGIQEDRAEFFLALVFNLCQDGAVGHGVLAGRPHQALDNRLRVVRYVQLRGVAGLCNRAPEACGAVCINIGVPGL